jgi:hypothetical protein
MVNRMEIIRKIKESLRKHEEIIFAYLHGSFADDLPFKDIDVAIFVNEEAVSRDDAIDYGLKITSITEIETGVSPLDIKVINYTPAGFKYHATKGRLLFSKDEEKRFDFLEETWKRYFDLLPKRRQILLDIVSP